VLVIRSGRMERIVSMASKKNKVSKGMSRGTRINILEAPYAAGWVRLGFWLGFGLLQISAPVSTVTTTIK
jgi:hypothetical protein